MNLKYFQGDNCIAITEKRPPSRLIVISQSLYEGLYQDSLIYSERAEVDGGESMR